MFDAFQKLGPDGTGSLALHDFVALAGGENTVEVRRLFGMLDEDASGTLQIAELGHALRHNKKAAKLAGRYPGQLAATDYSSTAQQLKEAGGGTAAIEVLDLGKKQYPDDPLIEKMIAESVESGSSPEELEMLKSLGYID